MQQERNPNFRKFIWKNYKVYLQIAAIAITLQWIIFKQIYPYPNFRGDSASYIGAALAHADATEWPVGYSKFLIMMHWFSHSDTFFVTIQYLLLELSALFFLFTLQYFIRPGKAVLVVLFAFTVFNPMFLHLANYIMSDGLFISLSLLWVSQLIWIIYRPTFMRAVWHAILLLCLFTVRYNAMFYPIVAALAIILSSLRPIVKIAGIGLSLLLIGLFVGYTESEFYKTNRVRQFAPFSGWQLANNALYMYQNIALSDADKVPDRFRELDSLVRKSFITDRQQGLVLNPYIKDYYIWGGQGSPLQDYLEYRWKGDTTTDMFIKWASMGPLYSAYGGYLVRKHPIEYFKHFVEPNISNFFYPSIADLGHYNQGNNRIDYRAAQWFGYKRLTMPKSSRGYEIDIIKPYPFAITLSNFAFLFTLLSYLLFGEYKKKSKSFNCIIIIITSFWLLNFGFSTAASSVELRYQVFQFILCVSFSSILIEILLTSSNEQKNEKAVITCQ